MLKTLLKKLVSLLSEKWLRWMVILWAGGLFLFCAGLHIGNEMCYKTEVEFWKGMVTIQEPESCAICSNSRGPTFHAPCLLDLSTGNLVELAIYEPSCRYPGELSENQSLDHSVITFTANGDPMFIDRLKDIQRCVTYLPGEEGEPMDPEHYCRNCRAILARAATTGYVLLDLYHLDEIEAYPIEEGAEYNIRIYSVSVTHDIENNYLTVTNIGHLLTC